MSTKIVAQLDANGYLVGSSLADESPLEPGTFLLPGGCIDADPPVVQADQRARWAGHGWEVETLPTLPEPDVPQEQPTPPKQFTSLEFLDLFTEAEQLDIVHASIASPHVKLWYDRMLAANFITLDDPRTEIGLNALVEAGLLGTVRKDQIVEAMQ